MNPIYAGSKKLTPQQTTILGLVAQGASNREIGERLHISEDTVKTHLRRICRVWRARNRAHCVHLAHERGIFPLATGPSTAEPADTKPPRVACKDPLAAKFTRVGLVHQAA